MALLRKVNERNQITIPPQILRKLGVRRGDYVEIESKDHQIVLYPKTVEDRFSESDWGLLETIVKKQVKAKQYKDYKNLKGARSHLKKLIK